MESRFSYKNIWKIAYPIILGSLAQDIITIADTAFAGRLGEIALGAIALGGIFYLAIVMIGFGFGIGVQVLIARRYGEEKTDEVKKIWQHSFFLLFGLATFLFLTLKFSSPFIINKIVSSQELYESTNNFLNIRLFGLFAAYLNISFRAFFIGIGNTKIISYTTIIMAVVNIVFDYLLMFGIGLFPKLDIQGAAYASVLAELVALIVFIAFITYNTSFRKYRFKIFQQLSLKSTKSILKIATPTMIQNFISFSAWFVFFIFVEKMGTQELAISNIIRSMYIIMLLPIMGFASAANSLTSQALGMNNTKAIKLIVKRTTILCLAGMSIIILSAVFIPTQIISLFTNDHNLISATIPVFYVVAFSASFLAIGFILFNIVTGTGNTITALTIEIVTIAFYLIGVYLISRYEYSIEYVWSMEVFYGSILATFSLIYLKFGNWSNKII